MSDFALVLGYFHSFFILKRALPILKKAKKQQKIGENRG